jgi:nitrate reductase gamma subunit
MSDHALFAVTPYVAGVSLVAVTLLRYLLARQRGALAGGGASITGGSFRGRRAWNIGLGGLAAAHVAILAFPQVVLAWNQSPARLVALEAVFFAFGVAALVGLLHAIASHLGHSALSRSSLIDTAFLGLLLVAVASGLGLAVLYRWASSWSAVTLTPYVHSVLSLEPRVALVKAMPYLVKLHVFSGLAVLALFPFTRLVRAVLVPLDRAASLVLQPVQRMARGGRRRLEDTVRVLGRRLGWLEEED